MSGDAAGKRDDGYRPDIDGLRGVAVMAVLLFHAGIQPFRGGYAGVDVFFVISGFLITRLILRESDGFSITNFYDRRIRRIIPALAVVLTAATAAAYVILLPDELRQFGTGLSGSALFFSNILFWRRTAGYFGADAGNNPLLHVWSLSVEEQFYLLWPLFLVWFGAPRRRRLLPAAIGALAVLSFAAGLVALRYSPSGSFFLLPTRAWELLAGAFLATGVLPVIRFKGAADLMIAFGLAAILFAFVAFDESARFPGWLSLFATLGAMAVLQAGQTVPSFLGAALGSTIPVFIGRISYSLYLWHWPLLVFARLFLNRELLLHERLSLLAAAGVLAAVTWKVVEQPFRRGRFRFGSVPASFVLAGFAGFLLGLAGFALYESNGLPWRVPPAVHALEADAGLTGRHFYPCLTPMEKSIASLGGPCVFGATRSGRYAVVWGDSFADALVPGLADAVARRGLALRELALSGCPPLLGVSVLSFEGVADTSCAEQNDRVARLVAKPGLVELVILHAAWQHDIGPPGRLSDQSGQPLDRDAARQAFVAALSRTVQFLTRHGVRVLIIGPVPAFAVSPLHCIGRDRLFGRAVQACDLTPAERQEFGLRFSTTTIRAMAARYRDVRVFFPMTALCDRTWCHAMIDSHLLYRDAAHLSPAGAHLVGQALQATLAGWIPRAQADAR